MSDGFIVFIRHEDKLLLLKRGEEVTDFANCWDGVYGVGDHNDLDHVFMRIEDSTGIQSSSLTLVRMGDARGIEFGNRLNEVTPILFVSDTSEIEPRTLYDEAMWVDPGYLNVLSPDEMDNSDDDISAIQTRPTVSQLGDMYGDVSSFLYMLKTTIGQEQKIANEIHARISGTGSLRDVQDEVFAVIHPRLMRGYIFVEASPKYFQAKHP